MATGGRDPEIRRVLFLIDRFENPRAGTEGQLYRLVSALGARDVECHLLALQPSAFQESDRFPCAWLALGHTDLADLRRRGRLLAGLVANLRPIKRMEDFVDALGAVRDAAPTLDGVIIGGVDPQALGARASGVGDRLHFLGQRDDVASCLRYLHMGVLCSESEGFSNALVEYMRAGLPSICTRAGGNPEAIEDGRTGLLYPVADVPALSQQLRRLATDEQRRERIGRAARAEARARFSMDAVVEAHLSLYRRVLMREALA